MALARALAVDPQVLLLDEPFGALDAKVREDLRAWLRRLHDEVHVTTVLVTHDQAEALDVADRIAVLNKGRIEQVGSPTEVYDTPANAIRDVVPWRGVLAQRNTGAPARHSGRPQPGDGDRHQRRHCRRPPASCGRPSTGSPMLGFEVRVELTSGPTGTPFTAQITRGDAEALGAEGRRHRLRAGHPGAGTSRAARSFLSCPKQELAPTS